MTDHDDELSTFRASCATFADRHLLPHVSQAERDRRFPRHILEAAGNAGFLGLSFPEHMGGSGAPSIFASVAIEEFARRSAGLATPMMGIGLSVVASGGDARMLDQYLKPAFRGEKLGALALTETEAGSDIFAMASRAHRTDAGWHLEARKMYITCAPIADFLVVVAYTDRSAGPAGLSAFVVDTDTPGVTINELEKLGHDSVETGEVIIEADLPAEALVGAEGKGLEYVREFLNTGRVIHASRSLGVAQAAFDLALAHARVRSSFGKPLVKHQAIEFKLARMLTKVRGARLQVAAACAALDSDADATAAACMAKLIASEVALEVSLDTLQVSGGQGYMAESPVQRLVRDAALYTISEGTTEMQLRTIARVEGFHSSLA